MMHSLDLTITGVERIKFDLFYYFFVCFFWEFSFSIFVRLLTFIFFLHENLQFTRLKRSFDFALLRHGLLFLFVLWHLVRGQNGIFSVVKELIFSWFFFQLPLWKVAKKMVISFFLYSLVWIILGQPTKHFF